MSPRLLLPLLLLPLLLLPGCMARPTITLPARTAEPRGVSLATTRTASGIEVAYATGFAHGPERLAFTVVTPGGLYDVVFVYRAGSDKAYELKVQDGTRVPTPGATRAAGPANEATVSDAARGQTYTGRFAAAPDFRPSDPLPVLLPAGEVRLLVGGGWGHYDIAAVELRPARVPPPPKPVATVPVDPLATPEARALLTRLARTYGRSTLTGVYAVDDLAYVRARAGVTPAILGGDLMDYSPSRRERGADPKGETERLLAAHRDGAILTVSWHWNAPTKLLDRTDIDAATGKHVNKRWYKGFYTNATDFDLAAALADPQGDDHRLLLRDIDAIADQLRKFETARVPVLWRPLHEAEGKWFWWGAKGPDAYRQLWRLLHDRLTRHHRLHNLLWVYTAGPDPAWYPGDDVVDLVGLDLYPADISDPCAQAWRDALAQYDGRKMIALTEFGGVPDLTRARAHGVHWLYFNTWTKDLGPRRHTDADLRRLFSAPTAKNQ
jgi:mannan endo-1,4-beta-mannosidase